jgi:hypothetical protein
MDNLSNLNISIKKGIEFLHSRQLSYGEFELMKYTDSSMHQAHSSLASSPYITTFILHSISFIRDRHLISEIISKSLKFLLDDMEGNGVWRFYPRNNRKVIYQKGTFGKIDMGIVPDLDDTACVSHCLIKNQVYFPDNKEYFYKNRTSQGIFQTWLLSEKSLLGDRDYIPPCNNVCCGVNANVLMYLGDNPETDDASEYINSVIIDNREFEESAYFPSPLVLYYLISRAYFEGAISLEVSLSYLTDKIINCLETTPLDPVSAIFAVASLLNLNQFTSEYNKFIDIIVDAQGTDGSWPIASFFIDNANNHYGSKELTTSFALEVLSRSSLLLNYN